MDNGLRYLSSEERISLEARGCNALNWDDILVSDDFGVEQLSAVRFGGAVEIGRGVRIEDSYVANYVIGEGSIIEGVTRLECRHATSFANGVSVDTINENGGRAILIYEGLSAQTAYIWAMYRHRTELLERLRAMVEGYAAQRRVTMGRVGRGCRVVGARFVREAWIGDGVVVEGASLIEDVTLLAGAYVGVDVKMRGVIAVEESRIDTGATLSRCFVGERVIVASGFSAVDSLFFASSHLENGEAAAIFAAPYTVSHHKSSLLIAGYFSFFNAGSGSNQSNHLFKCGPVHQAIHPRGCKFASGAYIMSPAREGAFTMVKGSHSRHHDTSNFPFSYLIESDGRSMLMPGANLVSYGTVRDIKKWVARDKRTIRRDVISFEEHNPYTTGAMVRAVNALHTLNERDDTAEEYMWERTVIRRAQLRRGLGLYNKAIAASIGSMLSRGATSDIVAVATGDWVDVAGAYMPYWWVMDIVERIEGGEISTLAQIDRAFVEFSLNYDTYAYSYAHSLLEQLLGHTPTAEEIASTIESAERSEGELNRQRNSDRDGDSSLHMAIGYGNDSQDEAVREADFRAVRDL